MLRRVFQTVGLVLLLLAGISAAPVELIQRTPISRKMVQSALQSWSPALSIEEEDINLALAGDMAQGAELRVIGVRRSIKRGDAQISLRCVPGWACVPFYVRVRNLPPNSLVSDTRAVRSGQKGTLLVQTKNSRLTISVRVLEAGVVGTIVRARCPETKRIYRARVIGPGVLEAIL